MVNRVRKPNHLLVSKGTEAKVSLADVLAKLQPLLDALESPAEFSADPEDIAALLHEVGLMQEDNR